MKFLGVICIGFCLIAIACVADTRTEHFDTDPNWDGHNNRTNDIEMREITQDFGYVAGQQNDGPRIGGIISPDGKPAFYAMEIPEFSLDNPYMATGLFRVERGAGNVLLGLFNNATINEWRTPNTMAFRINGRGETFHAHTEFCSRKWRATAGIVGKYDRVADRMHPIENPSAEWYQWSLAYDPSGNGGSGLLTATLNDHQALMEITPELRADGATFNRFGFLNIVKHADDKGEFYVKDLVVNGTPVDLSSDPKWDELNNHAQYRSENTRPRFNFGYTPTHNAKGNQAGEFGGLFFRGDCRYPEKLAYYGAEVDKLTLNRPIKASGKLSFHRGISDSTSNFGFFHSKHSVQVTDSQKFGAPSDFLGFSIGGPSAQGFFIAPSYRVHGATYGDGSVDAAPVIYPDGTSHDWTLTYEPDAATGGGTLSFTLDDAPPSIVKLSPEDIQTGAEFDRFGSVTSWIDGNGQVVYLDDITYTINQD